MNDRHSFSDLAVAIANVEQILASKGIEITDPRKSPFKRAEAILHEMEQTGQGRGIYDNTVDHRENSRKAFSLGDLALNSSPLTPRSQPSSTNSLPIWSTLQETRI